MTETAIILSIGEIELEVDDDAPLEAILTLPAILQDGSKLVLKLGTRGMLQLMGSAFRNSSAKARDLWNSISLPSRRTNDRLAIER